MHVGDALPGEAYLAERLGVSCAAMREAFGALAPLKRMRRTIEMRTGALVARNASPANATRIVALAEALSYEQHERGTTSETDVQFHLAIAEASGNILFYQVVVSFAPLMRVAEPHAWRTRQTEEQKHDTLERHRRLPRP